MIEDIGYFARFKPNSGVTRWENAVYSAECAIQLMDKGFCRYIQSGVMSGYESVTDIVVEQGNKEKYRFLPYSSWAVGGQGLMIFPLTHPETNKWFQFCHPIAREAYAMRDYLMDEPALDIPAYIQDIPVNPANAKHYRTRFTLRRQQTNPSNRILLLFCNFANDGDEHSTAIHFPNHTITNVEYIRPVEQAPDPKWNSSSYQLLDSNKTFRYNPTYFDTGLHPESRDVYARAYFITLN